MTPEDMQSELDGITHARLTHAWPVSVKPATCPVAPSATRQLLADVVTEALAYSRLVNDPDE